MLFRSIEATAFGAHGLEERVRALVEGPSPSSGRSHWRLAAFAAAAAFATVAFLYAASLHHAVETLLAHLF